MAFLTAALRLLAFTFWARAFGLANVDIISVFAEYLVDYVILVVTCDRVFGFG